MARYPSGQPITIPVTVQQRNTDGTYSLVDATTLTIVVKLAQADGTWLTAGTYSSPTHDSLGKYHQDIPAADIAALGHYQWTATSTGTGAGVTFGDFDVFDASTEVAVLPLQDGKDQLNIPQSTTTFDTELQAYIATIETSLEGLTGGPIVNRTITAERCEFSGWYETLQVRQRPLVSVTSITSILGTALDATGLDINRAGRKIRKKDGSPFSSDSPVTLVTYVAGWGTAVPAAISLAARIILDHLWDLQHGPSARPSMGSGMELVTPPGFSFAIPNYAAELLQGSLNGVPFADQVFAW